MPFLRGIIQNSHNNHRPFPSLIIITKTACLYLRAIKRSEQVLCCKNELGLFLVFGKNKSIIYDLYSGLPYYIRSFLVIKMKGSHNKHMPFIFISLQS